MKRVLWLLAFLGAVLLSTAPVLAADNFYVIATGPPPVGTKIISLPYTITSPGYYYLGSNLSYSGGDAITVSADNVTIDLGGFSLTGPSNNNYAGVSMLSRSNVEVRNGTITGWAFGVVGNGSNLRMIGVRANGDTYGINLGGTGHLIKGCMASQGSFGTGWGISIGQGTISNCIVMGFSKANGGLNVDNGGTISGNLVLNCPSIEGVYAGGPTTINYNSVYDSTTGIDAASGGSVIGNLVTTNSGQTGIVPSTNTSFPNLVDQNTVSGAGSFYGAGSAATVWGINGGR
jgi:hypothetical protein